MKGTCAARTSTCPGLPNRAYFEPSPSPLPFECLPGSPRTSHKVQNNLKWWYGNENCQTVFHWLLHKQLFVWLSGILAKLSMNQCWPAVSPRAGVKRGQGLPAGATYAVQLGFRCQVILHPCLAIGQFFDR